MRGKSLLLWLILLLISVAGFYGLLIMISMIHGGTLTPHGASGMIENTVSFFRDYADIFYN